MRIVIFKSQPFPNLRAFATDPGGQELPKQFAPWHAIGVVVAGNALPHKLDRAVAEKAITAVGYQLWRMKKPKPANKAAPAKKTAAAAG
jgi:hypothetical protein